MAMLVFVLMILLYHTSSEMCSFLRKKFLGESLKAILDESIPGIQHQCTTQFFESCLIPLAMMLAEGEQAILVEEEHVRASRCDSSILHGGFALLTRNIVLDTREVNTELDGLSISYRNNGFCLCDSFHDSSMALQVPGVKSLENFNTNDFPVVIYVKQNLPGSKVNRPSYCAGFTAEVVGVDFFIE